MLEKKIKVDLINNINKGSPDCLTENQLPTCIEKK